MMSRWTSLFKGPYWVQRYMAGDSLGQAERQAVADKIDVYRERLSSLSWFMKCLNQPIARQANLEDECTGHFWESRFKSQALLTEEAVISCMAYVDLNPVRTSIATTPEASEHTSIKERIAPRFTLKEAVTQQIDQQCLRCFEIPLKALSSFEGNVTEHEQHGLLFNSKDCIELIDYTGRIIRSDKKGAIPLHLPPILQRLNLDRKRWMDNATHFERDFYRKFGCKHKRVQDTG